MSRLIQCYGQGRASRTFECPHTSISLTLRAPTFRDRLAAESYAAAQWGDRAIESALDLRERANLNRALLIGFCLYEEGSDKPVGPAILELGEPVIESYHAVLDSIESPALEEWTQEEYDGLVELIQKKDPQIAALLSVSEGSKLFALLRYMADRLSNSPTSNSPTSC